MKTRINKFRRSEKNIMWRRMLFVTLIMIASAVVLSASSPIPQDEIRKKDALKERKLDLLEKLERGQKITPDDIRSLQGDFACDDSIQEEPDFALEPDLPDLPFTPGISGPFFHNCWNDEFPVISEQDFRTIREKLSNSIEELKKEVESFRNSEEFLNMQKELRKWGDDFKKEIENMKEDIFRSHKGKQNKEL